MSTQKLGILAAFLTLSSLSSAFALESISLICDDEGTGAREYVTVTTDKKKALISLPSLQGANAKITTTAVKVQPLFRNKLKNMDQVTIAQGGIKVAFRVDGQDFDGNARLEIKTSGNPNGDITIHSCILDEESIARIAGH